MSNDSDTSDQTQDVLARLEQLIQDRLSLAEHSESYVASLAAKGSDAILKKIGEEATETVMAAKDGDPDKIIYEAADLCFHTMIMLARYDISVEQVLKELDRRMGVSGLAEKAARSAPNTNQTEDITMGIGGISIWQLAIILVIVALIFGTKKLRGIGGDLGGAIKGFKTALSDEKKDAEEEMKDTADTAEAAKKTDAKS